MSTIISHSGDVIKLPWFGCYSGCAQDYCFIFGLQVPSMLFPILSLLLAFCGVLILFHIFNKYVRTGAPKP